MTPLQQERLRKKIADIKKALAADKKYWHGYYHDGGGLRYAPPRYYLKLEDYKGAITYYRWFAKNFPDDGCYGLFYFEWAIALFKTGKPKEAERMVLNAFMENIYLIDTFLEKPLVLVSELRNSAWALESLSNGIGYSKAQANLRDFADWLEEFVRTDRCLVVVNEFIALGKLLLEEPVGPQRSAMVDRRRHLLDDYKSGVK
jgi:tetratricopeptide (TPR) repeat protein